MKQFDYYFYFLLISAIFIWSKDFALIGSYVDSLPILISLPLFYWLGVPWEFRKTFTEPSKITLSLSVINLFLGVSLHSTLFYSLAWSCFLWMWLQARLNEETLVNLKPGFPLLVLGFPWLFLDGEIIGWWFRITGSWITEQLFSSAGFEVVRQGTFLLINNQPFSVDSACSGINTLQSLLIAGVYLGSSILKQQFRIIWGVPFLFFIAWLANTIRISIITLAALILGPEFAMGAFHEVGGLIVLGLMFILCWCCFYFIHRNFIKYNATISPPKTTFG
jgi:exosortase/archaeosortase family protein